MTTPLVRADTTINTNVKGSKVFALAFVKAAGVTDAFTESDIRGFVMPKLGDATLLGSAIVQLDSVSSGKDFHSGRGDEAFTGLLTKVFNNINNGGGGLSGATVTENPSDLADGINVYFMTMDGLNETAVRVVKVVTLQDIQLLRLSEGIAGIADGSYSSGDPLVIGDNTYSGSTYTIGTSNGNKYIKSKDFGTFSAGDGDFTLAFVVKAVNGVNGKFVESTINNYDGFYIRSLTGEQHISWYEPFWQDSVWGNSIADYINADYMLLMASYEKNTNKCVFYTKPSGLNVEHKQSIVNEFGDRMREFKFKTNSNETGFEVYDMLIIPEYMENDSVAYPRFGDLMTSLSMYNL